ncbi:MAG TPA: succinyl-diaminopimelate desuccinylase [Microbacteriaceae bacterium]|nr:succinyl-diaminopimelate desuccinylase [Microbacteriaceae bacterium]
MTARLDPSWPVDRLAAAVCDIESVSGNERALADAIEAALRAAPHLEVSRDGDAVVARTSLGRARRAVIAGHLDTVPVADNLPTRRELVDGVDTLIGRGTVDMKSGVAIQLKLAVELTTPSWDVTWVFYDHEEVDASLNGLGRLARHHPELLAADFAVLCEPTAAGIEGGCNGTLRARLRFHGVRAHSARPWSGRNAIHAAATALSVLAAHEPETVVVDGLAYREALNATMIAGGVAPNVIPDLAEVTVNYRFAPSRTGQEAVARLGAMFPDAELIVDDLAEGARPGLDGPIARDFVAAIGAEPTPKYGWTDVARFSALGIPAINYGPGDANLAHRDDERVPVAQILAVEAGLRAWLTA